MHRSPPATPLPLGRASGAFATALWVALVAFSAAAADEPVAKPDAQAGDDSGDVGGPTAARSAALLRVRLPLVGDADRVVESRVLRAVERLSASRVAGDDRRPLLVLEFVPATAGSPTEFERALRIARFLVSDRVSGVKTVAYLPKSIEGHAVLAVLACEEVAMAPEAELGRAGASEDPAQPLEPGVRAMYQQIAESRRTVPTAVAIAMVDRDAELVRVETDGGTELVLGSDLGALAKERTVVSQTPLSAAGEQAQFTGRLARELGFVQLLAADREALARALAVPADRLLEDQSLVDEWRPVMIDLDGPISQRSVRRFETLLATELDSRRVNWIGVRIDSSGGDWPAALRLAQTLAELRQGEARTVAYVARRAEGPAALVALACEQLVMHKQALVVGDRWDPADDPRENEVRLEQGDDAPEREAAAPRDGEPPAVQPAQAEQIGAAVATIRDTLAPATGRSWSLLAATVDPRLEVTRYANRRTTEVRPLSAEELAELPDRDDWRRQDSVTEGGKPLSLSGDRAAELGFAWQTVERIDDVAALYGFAEVPPTAEMSGALELVEALAHPGFAALLLVIGVVGIYIELSAPGIGLGGFISAVAFLLFFWSKFLDGTADWLEVLLFVVGVVFVLMELLVLPGLGVFGFGGMLMVLASLVLAGQTFLFPKTEAQLTELRDSLGMLAGAAVGCIAAGVALRSYLPYNPLFRRAVLMPPDEADRIELDRRELMADYEHLVGQSGVAMTPLLPAGRAEVAGELIDVIADGQVIERGERVVVVSAHATRVVVRRA
ncbi:MAG: NfeD family protein [Lacipirellulaceae bacterium]